MHLASLHFLTHWGLPTAPPPAEGAGRLASALTHSTHISCPTFSWTLHHKDESDVGVPQAQMGVGRPQGHGVKGELA